MASLDATISGLEVYQDCMPIVPPDPVNASFILELVNTGDVPASATVTSALFVDLGGMPVAAIDVVPAAYGPIPVGGSSMTGVNKVGGSLLPANACETLECGASYTFELTLDVDGTEVIASESLVMGCVF